MHEIEAGRRRVFLYLQSRGFQGKFGPIEFQGSLGGSGGGGGGGRDVPIRGRGR